MKLTFRQGHQFLPVQRCVTVARKFRSGNTNLIDIFKVKFLWYGNREFLCWENVNHVEFSLSGDRAPDRTHFVLHLMGAKRQLIDMLYLVLQVRVMSPRDRVT